MTAPVVVFAVGNPSRGDDAIGPVLFERLLVWLDREGLAEGFELIEDFQLQIDHALDLRARELALFIDAGEGTPAPFSFRQVQAVAGIAHTTHELPPEAVLQVYRQTEGSEPPTSFVLCVRGESFELGEPLSEMAEKRVQQAFILLQALCREANGEAWSARVSPA